MTYRGLFRLVRHVLLNFISDGPVLATEEYPWRRKLPGVVIMKAAPQYWVWNVEAFTSARSTKVLDGFISHLNDVVAQNGSVTDMRAVVHRCIDLIPRAKLNEKRSMLLLVALFNGFVREADRVPNWDVHFNDHSSVLEDCSVERLILATLLGRDWTHSAHDCVTCVDEYLRTRHRKTVLGAAGGAAHGPGPRRLQPAARPRRPPDHAIDQLEQLLLRFGPMLKLSSSNSVWRSAQAPRTSAFLVLTQPSGTLLFYRNSVIV